MPSSTLIKSYLTRLRILAGNSSVFHSVNSNQTVLKTINDFKQLLLEAIARNAISDDTIIQAADCLYDLKACDSKTNARICKAVEERPAIYTRPLYGGVLWSFHTSAGLNTRRRKVVKSSCNATVNAFMDELLALKSDQSIATNLDNSLRNLIVVGLCFKLPISTRTRLEQALVDAKVALKDALAALPTTVTYVSALKSLQIRCENVVGGAIESLVNIMTHHELLSVNTIMRAINTLYNWEIGPVGVGYRAIEVLNNQLRTPPQMLMKNTSALVKLYAAASRLTPQKCDFTNTHAKYTAYAANETATDKTFMQDGLTTTKEHDAIGELSAILLNYCTDVVDRCNSHNLLLLYNAMAHHILRDRQHCKFASGGIRSCVHRVSTEMHDALQLDSAATDVNGDTPLRLYDRQDILTIHRAALLVQHVCEDDDSKVAEIAKLILEKRHGTNQNGASKCGLAPCDDITQNKSG